MDNIKDGGSVNKSTILDDTNYDYLKAMMVAFLKSIGCNAWKIVVKGWKHPLITSQDGYRSLKHELSDPKLKMMKLLETTKS